MHDSIFDGMADALTNSMNQETPELESLDDDEFETEDELDGSEVEGGEGDDLGEGGEDPAEGEEPTDDADLHEVKWRENGKVVTEKVSLEELQKGYLRQRDYTKKREALKAELEADGVFGEELEELRSAAEVATNFSNDFGDDPVATITSLIAVADGDQTPTPQQASRVLVAVAKDMAAHGLLDPAIIERFGWTDAHIRQFTENLEARSRTNDARQKVRESEAKVRPIEQEKAQQEFITLATDLLNDLADGKLEGTEVAAFRSKVFQDMIDNQTADIDKLRLFAKSQLREMVLDKREASAKKAPTKKTAAPKRKSNVATPSRQGRASSPKPQSIHDELLERLLNAGQ